MTRYALPPAESRLEVSSLLSSLVPISTHFSEKLQNHFGVRQCLFANSARALFFALLCHLRKEDRSGRNEILIPGYTCYSVAAATVKAGLRIGLYDIDPWTFEPDLESVKQQIGPRTLAVVGQHLFGIPCKMSGLVEVAGDSGAFCIEDAAQAMEAGADGQLPGTTGDYGLFSFGRGKPFPLGAGGALISRSHRLGRIRKAVNFKKPPLIKNVVPFLVQLFSNPGLYWILEKLPLRLGETVFDTSFEVRQISSFYERLGSHAWKSLGRLNEHRRAIGSVYKHFIHRNSASAGAAAEGAYTRYPLFVDNNKIPLQLKKYGVRNMYPQALCDLPEIGPYLVHCAGECPGARTIAKRLITLPTHLGVDSQMAEKIANEVIRSFSLSNA